MLLALAGAILAAMGRASSTSGTRTAKPHLSQQVSAHPMPAVDGDIIPPRGQDYPGEP